MEVFAVGLAGAVWQWVRSLVLANGPETSECPK
jgi:hypothetical protein